MFVNLGVLLQEKCKLVVLAGGICIKKSYKKCSLLVRLSARSLQDLAGFLEEKVLFSCICKNCCKILQEVNKNWLDLAAKILARSCRMVSTGIKLSQLMMS